MIMILNTTLTLVICVLEAVRGIPKFYEGRVTREQLWRKKGLRIFPRTAPTTRRPRTISTL